MEASKRLMTEPAARRTNSTAVTSVHTRHPIPAPHRRPNEPFDTVTPRQNNFYQIFLRRKSPTVTPCLSDFHAHPTHITMICRACLRASRAGLRSEASQRLASPQPPSRALSSLASTRFAAPAAYPTSALLQQCALQTPARLASRTYSTATESAASEQPASAGLEKPADLDEGESQVWDILIREFAPTNLVVRDISGGCGSMYGVDICSEKFRGLNMLKQQRLVNAALGELVKQWHGIQIKTSVP